MAGRNCLSTPNADEIVDKLSEPQFIEATYQPFGDGHAAMKIVEAMENYMLKNN